LDKISRREGRRDCLTMECSAEMGLAISAAFPTLSILENSFSGPEMLSVTTSLKPSPIMV